MVIISKLLEFMIHSLSLYSVTCTAVDVYIKLITGHWVSHCNHQSWTEQLQSSGVEKSESKEASGGCYDSWGQGLLL